MNVDLSGVYLSVEEHGCMYTVCTEGELFYAPMYRDGTVNLEEFDMVEYDLYVSKHDEMYQIQSTLIDMMTSAGLYFKKPVAV